MILNKKIIYLFAIIALLAMSPGGSADQANFPDIYIDGASAGDGSLATPYSDFASINWTTGGDNSVYDAVAAGKDVTINLKRGVTWREQLIVGASGSAAHPITIQAYGEGADPIINGADVVSTWEESYGANILSNGAFTTNTTDWDPLQGAILSSEAGGQDGNCLQVLEDDGANPLASQSSLDVISGKDYRLSFYVKEGTESTYQAKFNDSTGANAIGGEATADWVYDEDIFTSAATSSHAWVGLQQMCADEAATTIFFDTVSLQEKITNLYQKTFTNEPKVVVEDGTLLTFIDWDADISTTYASMSAGTFAVDTANKIAYVWCTDDADPDTHTMEVSAETGDAGIVIKCRDRSYITFNGLDVTQGTRKNINVDSLEGNDVSNIIVQNCTSRYSGHSGISLINWANLEATHPVTDCLVDSCTVYENRQHGIFVGNHVTSSTISNNTSYNNGWGGVSVATGGHGITAWSDDEDSYPDGIIIESNTVYGNYAESTDGKEGTGIQLDNLTRNSIVRYNIVYDNEGSGLIGNVNQDCSFYYNVVYGNGIATHQGGIWILESDGCEIYNNVFYDNRYGVSLTNSAANVTIKNNIFSESTQQEVVVASGSTTGHAIDHNCVYHSGGGTFMNWEGADYNWADWLTNSSQDANSLNTNPLMADPGSDDFTLQVGSPCINRGTFVGLLLDYLGLPVPIGHRPDIGAYEHKNGGAVIH